MVLCALPTVIQSIEGVNLADFIEEITEAPIPDRTLSFYEKLFGSLEDQPSAGGGAAMSKPHHRREPPAARADA
jgi:hypothetical protein